MAIKRMSVGNREMKEKLVSIITPMHNAEKFVARTIESVQKQTYTDWEMIIVDDGSSDGSADIVQTYAKSDTRIHYKRLDQNAGVAQARNIAIQSAVGRYIAFLDSDDIWKPDKLRRQLALMQETGTMFCYTACGVIDEDGKESGRVRHVPERVAYKDLLKGNVIPCLTVLLDRKQLSQQGINVAMPLVPHEDYAAWLSILKQGVVADGINEILAEYRVNKKSVSANKLQAMKWTWQIYRKQEKLGLVKSMECFLGYLYQAGRKHI